MPDELIYMTPGVHLSATNDSIDQQYRTPEDAIIRDGCDAIIVGRGITQYSSDNDFLKIIQTYQNRAWNAYLTDCQKQ